MEKRHFDLLEEGRLNNIEISSIQGGMTCKPSVGKTYLSDGTTSVCPVTYKSCNSLSDKLVCNIDGGYVGPTGPAGLY